TSRPSRPCKTSRSGSSRWAGRRTTTLRWTRSCARCWPGSAPWSRRPASTSPAATSRTASSPPRGRSRTSLRWSIRWRGCAGSTRPLWARSRSPPGSPDRQLDGSASAEARRALLHKGGGALAVIRAVERLADALLDPRPGLADIAARKLVEDRLHPGDGERRVGRHRGGEAQRGVDRVAVDKRVGETHLAGRVGVVQLAAEQDALGVGEADRRLQQMTFADRVDRAELCRRNAEAGAMAHDAKVAGERDGAAAAGAGSLDSGDTRLGQGADRGIGGLDGPLINRAAGAVGARPGEFADVGAGAEVAADAGQHDDPDAAVLGKAAKGGGEVAPRREVERVA